MRPLRSASWWCSFLVLALATALPSPATASVAPSGASTTWQPIPKAPIDGRVSAGTVWTGDEMIVWGGVVRERRAEAVGDGAAFDPVAASWHSIRSAPQGMLGGGGQAAAWTGRRAVFWAGNSLEGPARGAVYDPRTDRWRLLSRGPLGPREGYLSAWTGDELVIVGGSSGDALARPIAAAVDPRTDAWHRLSGLNTLDGLLPSGVVWSGDRLFVGGTVYDCPPQDPCTSGPVFLSYDLATDQMEELDLTNAPAASFTPIGWTGGEVFGTGDDASSVLFYDSEADRWRSGTAAPCALEDSASRQVAFLDDRYVTACGPDALQVYTLASDAWETSPAGHSPLNSRWASEIAWTGSDLIVWSGIARRTGNSTPNSGKAITLLP